MAQVDYQDFDFISFEIPQFVQKNNSGEFIRLTHLLLSEGDEQSIEIDLKILPPRRAYKAFEESKNALLFPFLNFGIKKDFFRSEPFYFKKDYLFYHTTKKRIPYNGARLCLTTGYPYDQEFIKKNQFQVIETISDEACLKMLEKDRVDYFLCEGFSGAKAILNSQVRNINLINKVVSSLPVTYATSNTKEGKELIQMINRRIKILKSKGLLKEIFEPAAKTTFRVLKINYNPTHD